MTSTPRLYARTWVSIALVVTVAAGHDWDRQAGEAPFAFGERELRGGLRVRVMDASNAVVPGASVTVTCEDRLAKTSRTDERGVTPFTTLPLGDCSIAVERAGFKTWRGKGVAAAGDGATVDATLALDVLVHSVPVKPKSAARRFVDWLSSCKPR